MKIWISYDMEGVAGIVDWDQCRPGNPEYPLGCALLLDDDPGLHPGRLGLFLGDADRLLRLGIGQWTGLQGPRVLGLDLGLVIRLGHVPVLLSLGDRGVDLVRRTERR